MSARMHTRSIRLAFSIYGILMIAGSDLAAQARPVVRKKHLDAAVFRIAARRPKGTDNSVPAGILAGHQIAGAFGPATPRLSNGSHYQEWIYKGRAGER